MPTNCNSLRDLKEYISDEKPHVDYCLIEIDDENYVPKNAWDEIEVPISQGMRSYLVDWCIDLMGDEGDIGLFVMAITGSATAKYRSKNFRKQTKHEDQYPRCRKYIHCTNGLSEEE